MIQTYRWHSLILASILCVAMVGCATHPVTIGGVATENEFIISATNRAYNAERVLVVVGQVLIAARDAGRIGDDDWIRIASVSTKVREALSTTKMAILTYQQTKTDENEDALADALLWLDVITREFNKFSEGVE